jgi:hypothetical protein
VVEEWIQLAKDMRSAAARGKEIGMPEDGAAFYNVPLSPATS